MAKSSLQGFMNFVREQGVVGLAVGLVLGSAVKSVVDSLVNSIINPLIGVILGSGNSLVELHFTINEQQIRYGIFLNSLLQFVIIAAVVYFVVTGLGLDKLDRKKDEAVPVVEKAREGGKKAVEAEKAEAKDGGKKSSK